MNQTPPFNLSSVLTVAPDPITHSRRPFLTPLPDLPGEFLLVLDNTSLEKIKRCHKAGQNYLILGREAHARNAALTFGGALHEGLEIFHHFQWDEANDAHDLARRELDFGCVAQDQAILRYFTETPAPPDDYRTVNNCLEVLKHYRRRSDPLLHPDYEWEIQSDEKGPIIERAFEIPLSVLEMWVPHSVVFKTDSELKALDYNSKDGTVLIRIHLAWSGRIDLIARTNGSIRIVDHKTTSIGGDQFIQSFRLSSQTIGYLWAARRLFPSLNVEGFCLNAIHLKKPAVGIGLTNRGPRGGPPALDFFRAYFDYTKERVQRWERDTVLLIEDFLHSLSRGVFPLNDRHCFDKFGQCPYLDVCSIDNEVIGNRLLMSDAFKQVTWNPTA